MPRTVPDGGNLIWKMYGGELMNGWLVMLMVVAGGGQGGPIEWARWVPGERVPSGSLVVYSKNLAIVQYLIVVGS